MSTTHLHSGVPDEETTFITAEATPQLPHHERELRPENGFHGVHPDDRYSNWKAIKDAAHTKRHNLFHRRHLWTRKDWKVKIGHMLETDAFEITIVTLIFIDLFCYFK